MQCQELERVLEQWPPGALPRDAAAHVEACTSCRALVADLDAIQQAAGRLGKEDLEVAPPERVWVNLRAQLEAEGLIHAPQRAARPAAAGWREAWWMALPRPALAGAYVALLLAAALLGAFRSGLPQVASRDVLALRTATAGLGTRLNAVENSTIQALPKSDPTLTATLRRNLDAVDNFIALCEKSVREEPQNELAREYLYGAYQQKAELLSAMMERGTAGE